MHGLAGVTLGAIIQAITCFVVGSIFGLIFIWKLALVGIGMLPLVFLIVIELLIET